MSIPFDMDCLRCHYRRNIATAQALGDERQLKDFSWDLMELYQTAPEEASSPWFCPQVNLLLKKHYGVEGDRFREEKAQSNAFVLERMDQIRSRIQSAEDPVYAGLQFAVLGNYIDFSALQGQVSFEKLDALLDDGESMELDRQVYQKLCQDLSRGKSLLYLTDNAGEIGFDRLLAEEIQKKYPHLTITFCVRGGPAMNDATREDAIAVGLPFPVIDNGNLIPGTQLDLLSRQARQAMDAADVILAKGMGNAETMFGCEYNVYYAFLIKCSRFVHLFQKPKFTPMLVRQQD